MRFKWWIIWLEDLILGWKPQHVVIVIFFIFLLFYSRFLSLEVLGQRKAQTEAYLKMIRTCELKQEIK